MREEIKKLKKSIAMVDAKLSFLHNQFGELRELFKEVVHDVDAMADLVGSYEERLKKIEKHLNL